jgi:hypothetical protein
MMGTQPRLGACSPVLELEANVVELIARSIQADKWLVPSNSATGAIVTVTVAVTFTISLLEHVCDVCAGELQWFVFLACMGEIMLLCFVFFGVFAPACKNNAVRH